MYCQGPKEVQCQSVELLAFILLIAWIKFVFRYTFTTCMFSLVFSTDLCRQGVLTTVFNYVLSWLHSQQFLEIYSSSAVGKSKHNSSMWVFNRLDHFFQQTPGSVAAVLLTLKIDNLMKTTVTDSIKVSSPSMCGIKHKIMKQCWYCDSRVNLATHKAGWQL